MAVISFERVGGCFGVARESVKELEAQCKTRWVAENEPNGNAYNSYRNRKDYFKYPECFPEMCGESLEVRLIIAQRLKQLADAGFSPEPDDELRIELGDSEKRRGFHLHVSFWDRLSVMNRAGTDYTDLHVPRSADIGSVFVQPKALAQKWLTKRRAAGSPYSALSEGASGWRIPAKRPEKQGAEWQAHIRQANIKTLQERAESPGCGLDSATKGELNELLEAEAAWQIDLKARYQRWGELRHDFEAYRKRGAAVKELGLKMPPLPDGWYEMLRECDETVAMTQRMAKRFAKMGRDSLPIPLMFIWHGIHRDWLMGGLFAVIFNEEDGPYETMVLPSFTIPIRAKIAPEKACAEWQAIKAYRERWQHGSRAGENGEVLEELTAERASEILGGFSRTPLDFTEARLLTDNAYPAH